MSHLVMDTFALGCVISAIRAHSGLAPVRQCSCRAYHKEGTPPIFGVPSFFYLYHSVYQHFTHPYTAFQPPTHPSLHSFQVQQGVLFCPKSLCFHIGKFYIQYENELHSWSECTSFLVRIQLILSQKVTRFRIECKILTAEK